jgi:Zn-dependent protease
MASRETAVFRPALGPVRGPLLYGAVGGAALGVLLGLAPPDVLLFAGFGLVAAWIAVAWRQAAGLRAVADEWGLRVLGPREEPSAGMAARWSDLRLGFGFAAREGGQAQRYAILADPRGKSFAFADLAGRPPCGPATGADGRPVPVADVREAALLLGLVVQRSPAWYVLPPELSAPAAPAPAAAPGPAEPAPAPAPAAPRERGGRVGLLGLLGKLGTKVAGSLGKVGATALKAAKTTNLGWAAASAATYSLIFSWKFALAIMLQLFVHEYGHVHAMRKTGMKVRGMYFIPFLGALAVTEDQFTSRRQQAYVALNGPVWGSAFALVPAALYLWTREPAWATVAAWWAIINLFNLLPIAPLDGGRVMQSFAFSYSSGLGLAVSVAGLAGAVALGSVLGFGMIWLLALLGAMELVAEAQARAGARALRLLPEAGRFGPVHWLWLRAVVGPQPGGSDEPLFLRALERSERAARAEPMTAREMARWGLAYASLALALVLLVWLVRHVPGASAAAGILE